MRPDAPELGNHVIILGVRSYPEPKDSIVHVDAQGAIMQADADRTVSTDVLEPKGWMSRISLEELEALVSELLYMLRQRLVAPPEPRRCVVIQRGRDRPAA